MENVLLVILLIVALALIAIVLMQRSEGGGLGMGGGGGGGAMSARGAATALGKITWVLGIGFLAISLTMTIVSARNAADRSVIDRVEETAPTGEDGAPATSSLPSLDDLVPQTGTSDETPDDSPVAPPRAE